MNPPKPVDSNVLRERKLNAQPVLDELARIVPVEVLQQTQDTFSAALGVPIIFSSLSGKPITESNSLGSFCWQVTRHGEAQEPCCSCTRLDGTSRVECPMDIRDVILPINAGDLVVGYLVASQEGPEKLEEAVPAISSAASMISMLATARRESILARIHDSLTGLSNRAHFWECLAEELDLADQYNYPVSLLIVDLNEFGRINDVYGHDTGDHVLKTVGELIRKETRSSDVAGRYSGDLFLVMLRCADETGAETVAWRLRNRISDVKITARGQLVPVSANIGQITYPACASREPDALFRQLLASLEQSGVEELKKAS